jgi:predicted HTH transcriptional regulator
MVEAAAKIFSDPPIGFSTKQWQVEGKTVLEIGIDPSDEKPHFAKDDNGKWLAYIRIDDENVLAHKIQVNVWKKQKSTKGILFSYTDNEKHLIDLFRKNKAMSFSKYLRNSNIGRNKAEKILTDFVLMDIVRIKTFKGGTLFNLNSEFNSGELEKLI